MNIVIFRHPESLGSQSMPRFANLIEDGMRERGHQVESWSPAGKFSSLVSLPVLKKWLGYVDQYFLFPREIRRRLSNYDEQTLFVFADHALGPWVPLVSNRHHVIHCHDFLAQFSALGLISDNPAGWTGKKYQSLIRRGYRMGSNFISVSEKTRQDLHRMLLTKPKRSEMVYNGLNTLFKPQLPDVTRINLSKHLNLDLSKGYILHVGGNQWYKNRVGVIEIYDQLREANIDTIPLLLIGKKPNKELLEAYESSHFKNDIHFLAGMDDDDVFMAYAGASAFLFPSLAEGFGWPIAEAMASGTIVVTTNQNPMLEVAGDAAFVIDRRPLDFIGKESWAKESAIVLQQVLNLTSDERELFIAKGLSQVKKFNLKSALDKIEVIYKDILLDKPNK